MLRRVTAKKTDVGLLISYITTFSLLDFREQHLTMKIGSSAALLFVLGCLTSGEAFHIVRGVQSKLHGAFTPRQGGTDCQLVSKNINEDDEVLLLHEEEGEDIYELQSQFYPLDTDPLRFIDTGDDRRRSFKGTDLEFFLEIIIPVMTPLIAFLSYEPVAALFSASMVALSENNWVAVDGGAYQAKIIAPVINAIVVPAIAVLFATLTATTISTLRLRQVEIRRAINMEAGELRNLESLVNSLPVNEGQDRLRNYLVQYASRVIHESQPRVGSGSDIINPRRGMDCELNGFVQVLSDVHEQLPPALVDQAFMSVATLRQQRYNRITALQSTYPALHYVVLGVLAFGESTCFLMEADQEGGCLRGSPCFCAVLAN